MDIVFGKHQTSQLADALARLFERLNDLASMPESKGTYGDSAMSHLNGEGFRANAARRLADRLAVLETVGEESSLNGAGLKLFAKWESRLPALGGGHVLRLRVGGDQVCDYVSFACIAHQIFVGEHLMTEAECDRVNAYLHKNDRKPRRAAALAASAAKAAEEERPVGLRIAFGNDPGKWHYVLRVRRDGTLIPHIGDMGGELAGEPFTPQTPVSQIVERALALGERFRITQIEISDIANKAGQRKLLKTEDDKTLQAKQLRLMVSGLAGR
jgi:hypothetical protein